ncbi:hypothetical protein J2Y38_004657 [Flavobacterium sp. 2755]|nr:hypothetical protein [Flavobacterium sp. 2755]
MVFIVASKSSVEISRMESCACCLAALLITMSKPPSAFTACSSSERQKFSSLKSPGIATAFLPSAFQSAITSLASSSSSVG